jgi:DNA ligase (NAD+)
MDLFQAQEKIAELSEQIRTHNYDYYMNDSPQISDYDFDRLLEELQHLEKEYPQKTLRLRELEEP